MAPESDPRNDIAEADARADEAQASLESRIDELGRRYRDAKRKLDISEHIVARPWTAVAIAAAAGALLAAVSGGGGGGGEMAAAGIPPKRALLATAGLALFRVVKYIAADRASAFARDWLHQRFPELGPKPTNPA